MSQYCPEQAWFNKRFITRLKIVIEKNATITNWKKARSSDWKPTRRILTCPERKENKKKKQRAIFYVQSEVFLEKEATNQPKNLQQCSCDISRDSVRSNTYELLTKCEVKI